MLDTNSFENRNSFASPSAPNSGTFGNGAPRFSPGYLPASQFAIRKTMLEDEMLEEILENPQTRRWKRNLDAAFRMRNGQVAAQNVVDRLWTTTVNDANTELDLITDLLGMPTHRFNPEDVYLRWMADYHVQQACRKITGREDRLFGCANLARDTLAYPGSPSFAPPATVFLSDDWDDEHVAAAMQHECSHLALHRVRQIVERHDALLEKSGIARMDRGEYKELLSKFAQLNRQLDEEDAAWFNPRTATVEINKQSDVWQHLYGLVDEYIRGVEKAGRKR